MRLLAIPRWAARQFWPSMSPGEVASPSSDELAAIRRMQLRALVRMLPAAAGGNAVVAGSVAAGLWGEATAPVLGAWLVAIGTICLLRLLAIRQIRATGPDSPMEAVDRLIRWAILLSGLSGALWGMLGIAVVTFGDAAARSFVDCVLTALCAAAMASSLPVPMAARAYILLAVVPTGLAHGARGGGLEAAWLALSLVYVAALLMLLEGAHASVVEALLGRLRNERLAGQLAAAVRTVEAASQVKSQFLATMSHEVRTPLNGMIGMTQLLLQTPLTPAQRGYVETARLSGDALLALVNKVLDYSRLDAGRIELEKVPFELDELLEGVMAPYRALALDRGLTIVAMVSPKVPRRLLGDAYRLRQVLTNLLDNAVKFTERGRVTVRVAVDDARGEDVVLAFTVEDTGPGIPEAKQARIFDAFIQGDGSTTRRYGGSGLGLAICRQLCLLLGSGISVRSTPGRGTAFRFTARLSRRGEEAPVPAQPPARAASIAARVLLVEDNNVNLLVACGMLGRIGCDVQAAMSGREALEMFAPGRFDLVLMDCLMPEMDGFETTAALRAREPATGPHTPIVALTANAVEGDRDRCLAAGMDDYLSKPLRLAELRRMVARWAVARAVAS